MLTDHLADIFHRHIDASMRCIEVLAEPITEASERMVECMLSEHKLLCCGDGGNALHTHQLASNLLNRFQYERPSLPAINLAGDAIVMASITSDTAYGEVFSRQILALGQAGDIAFIAFQGDGSAAVVKAVQAAHEREMSVIALCNSESSEANSLLTSHDIEICIPDNNRARVMELHMLVVNSLCELIDMQLFGTEA
ncbi:MAG: D-sedoheptulose 7-phosphate isomerase [Bermanella sp.]|jgi:D-sedoheptulose 7-phosphate isomerase